MIWWKSFQIIYILKQGPTHSTGNHSQYLIITSNGKNTKGTMPKSWRLQTTVLEKTPESPLYSKEIKPVNLKGKQPWIFTGRTDAEAPVFWSPDANSWLIGKVPHAGKDWGQKEKRTSEDEMAGWHHWCDEHELQQTLEDGEGQGSWHAAVHGVEKRHDWTTKQQQ